MALLDIFSKSIRAYSMTLEPLVKLKTSFFCVTICINKLGNPPALPGDSKGLTV